MSQNDVERLVSDDGMWGWNGTEWVPTAAQLALTTTPLGDSTIPVQGETVAVNISSLANHPDAAGSYEPRAQDVVSDMVPTEHLGAHRETLEFDAEKWAREREHLQVRGIIMTPGKEHEERDSKKPLLIGAAVGAVAVFIGAGLAIASLFTGTDHGDPEDAVRGWHNAIIAGDAAKSCEYAGPQLFASMKDATGTAPSCLAAAQVASTAAVQTGSGVISDVKMTWTEGEPKASAEVTYDDSKTATFTLSADEDRGWLLDSMSGGPADLGAGTGTRGDALTPTKGAEATQAEELLKEMESGDRR